MINITRNSGCTIQFCLKELVQTPQTSYLFDVINLQHQYKNTFPDLTPESDNPYSTFYLDVDWADGNYRLDIYEANDIQQTNKLLTDQLKINTDVI